MRLPVARGPLSAQVVGLLSGPCADDEVVGVPVDAGREDAALTLWVLHELHYRGFDGVDERWEWAPGLMPLRRGLEDDFEALLRARYAQDATRAPGTDLTTDLLAVIEGDDGPSLARHVQRHASHDEVLDLLRQRSIYHLKEADPTSWVIPRLTARAKAALVEVQSDEYGAGQPARLHHQMFATGMGASGLDASYGAYVDQARLSVLEQNNALSMFGLQRRLRGAALGHLAAVESTSSLPSRQLAQGLDRLGFPAAMSDYYVEHVEADAVHEQLAVHDICGVLVHEEPDLHEDVLFGAWTCLDLEARMATQLLREWEAA